MALRVNTLLFVKLTQLDKSFVLSLSVCFSLVEELSSSFGEGLSKTSVTNLACDEVLIACGRLLAVKDELVAFKSRVYLNRCQ